ncbi:SprT-like family protein [Flavobacterium croceum DSM 17960]|uniref:SprT-like family protein n=1 Tax=Flavobacterium croceum DSM 17960 TaxID=1121886 RepID=A0A2S4N5F6_9FLAO|nr:SprT-like domain-containing protein [Flavobacterium croceum]POS00935.1 SprT-like family protein [Flavobacterium croceum DSM 17960]
MKKPTQEFYTLLDNLYEYYNQKLFSNELPAVMFVITRKKNVFGYFISKRWQQTQELVSDEIAINPLMFGSYPMIEILKTLVHEMVHLWQYHFGEPSQRTYHNAQWGEKMQDIGLMPSATGEVGGKKTGQQMMEYVIPNGVFESVTKELFQLSETDIELNKIWFDRNILKGKLNPEIAQILLGIVPEVAAASNMELPNALEVTQGKKNKLTYICPSCKIRVWGKPELNINCNDCTEQMQAM